MADHFGQVGTPVCLAKVRFRDLVKVVVWSLVAKHIQRQLGRFFGLTRGCRDCRQDVCTSTYVRLGFSWFHSTIFSWRSPRRSDCSNPDDPVCLTVQPGTLFSAHLAVADGAGVMRAHPPGNGLERPLIDADAVGMVSGRAAVAHHQEAVVPAELQG